jgi:hypothetical protein
MACECDERHQRVYPARNSFSILLSVNPESKLDWTSDKVSLCLYCGDNCFNIPMEIIQALREADPEFVEER